MDEFSIASLFDEHTMSVHLRANTLPRAKKGPLGSVTYAPISDTPSSVDDLTNWVEEIEQKVHSTDDGFIELSRPGMKIIQLGEYRIAIAKPPFSDAMEITAVKPVTKTTLSDYDLPDDILDRITSHKRGVLIAGSPGAGKSTFAQALAEHLHESSFVVKTMEQPRDLQVSEDITQYTTLEGTMENTADALLLVRPDYTIYDEVRKTSDFAVYADMRLAGVGMVGVVHATRAIDSLQRLIGRVELGLIPQITDTIIYIEDGEIDTIYTLTTTVKTPHGMNSEDLARPVIHVENYETGEPEYEVYTFNSQVVTVPIDGNTESTTDSELQQRIEQAIISTGAANVDVQMTGPRTATVYVDKTDISRVIGQNGSQVTSIENRLNVSLDLNTTQNQ